MGIVFVRLYEEMCLFGGMWTLVYICISTQISILIYNPRLPNISTFSTCMKIVSVTCVLIFADERTLFCKLQYRQREYPLFKTGRMRNIRDGALSARVGLRYCMDFSAHNTLADQHFGIFSNPEGH